MAKKKARTPETVEPEEIKEVQPEEINDRDNTNFVEHSELTSESLPKTTDQYLLNWLARSEIQDNFYQVTLWKFDKSTSGESKSIVDQFQDEILSEHEIGLRYGAGRYLLIINAQDKEGKNRIGSKRIKLHERYDELHRRHLFGADKTTGSGSAPAPGLMIPSPAETMSNTLNLMRELMTMFLPLIAPKKSADNSELLTGMYKSFNTVMKQNLLDNSQFYNDMQRSIFDMSETVETDGELSGIQGFINGIAPIIENILPLILGGGKVSANTVNSVKNLPLYAELTKSNDRVKALINYIEKKNGKKAATEVLKKFNLKVPK